MSIEEVRKKLRDLADEDKARVLRRFFKTGPGEYGEGDIFLGLTVPQLRKLAREWRNTPDPELRDLISSPVHEERMLALFLLMREYGKGDRQRKKDIYTFYLSHARFVNNWDLVDLSAPHIVGDFLLNRSRKPLYRLARSESLWERRIAVLATFTFIRQGQFSDTLKIAEILLSDPEDLIRKAVGWMLREVGKRDIDVEEKFLKARYKEMPRTMLRYAIEKFAPPKRKLYLEGKI
jgi:3-methyladenine DNA glycosylase AlkD